MERNSFPESKIGTEHVSNDVRDATELFLCWLADIHEGKLEESKDRREAFGEPPSPECLLDKIFAAVQF